MGKPYVNMELASFMSCSKSYTGECGLRAGFVEILNMCPEVKAMFYKLNTALLCLPTTGQACTEAFVCPPEKGEPSYELFTREKEDIFSSLKVHLHHMNKILVFQIYILLDTSKTSCRNFKFLRRNQLQWGTRSFVCISTNKASVKGDRNSKEAKSITWWILCKRNTWKYWNMYSAWWRIWRNSRNFSFSYNNITTDW